MVTQWVGCSKEIPVTFARLCAVLHRLEVDGGDGTGHLHGLSFQQTGVPLVPTSPLQEQTLHKNPILEGGGG